VDRTLTGKQEEPKQCPQNQVLHGVGDTAYGGGQLTLSPLGQSIEDTFCAKCYVAIVTAGDASGYESAERDVLVKKLGAYGKLESTSWTGPSLKHEARANCSGVVVDSPLVLGCIDGTKHFAVASVVAWLEAARGVKIEKENVWHFDDREENVASFVGTGFNARTVSCSSRDGARGNVIGLCGASKSEIVDEKNVALCSGTISTPRPDEKELPTPTPEPVQPPAPPCLCSFDVDRTLTGKQEEPKQCPQNQVLHGVGDTAYGGGQLTLSPLGQSIEDTFCAKCYVAIVTAGDASGYESAERDVLVKKLGAYGKLESTSWTGPSLKHEARANCSGVVVDSPLVLGCIDGTKHFAVASVVAWLEAARGVKIEKENVWHFDDREGNVAEFVGTGFNARVVSCSSRDGPLATGVGLCGASTSDIVDEKGVALCSGTIPERSASVLYP